MAATRQIRANDIRTVIRREHEREYPQSSILVVSRYLVAMVMRWRASVAKGTTGARVVSFTFCRWMSPAVCRNRRGSDDVFTKDSCCFCYGEGFSCMTCSGSEMYLRYRQNPTAMCKTCFVVTLVLLVVRCSCDEDVSAPVKPDQPPLTSTSGNSALRNDNVGQEKMDLKPESAVSADLNDTSIVTNETQVLRSEVGVLHRFGLDTGAVKRTFYVVAALTGVVLLYFTFKGIRTMRRRRRKPRRYGLLADSKEMKQFHDEEEDDSDVGDEDATLFDARKHKSNNKRGP